MGTLTTKQILTNLEADQKRLNTKINFIRQTRSMKTRLTKAIENPDITKIHLRVTIDSYSDSYKIDRIKGMNIFENLIIKRERQIKDDLF